MKSAISAQLAPNRLRHVHHPHRIDFARDGRHARLGAGGCITEAVAVDGGGGVQLSLRRPRPSCWREAT